MPPLDPAKALLKGADFFKRYRVPERGEPMHERKLDPEEMIAVIERGGERRAFLIKQLAYHHAAQGELGGQPYLVTF